MLRVNAWSVELERPLPGRKSCNSINCLAKSAFFDLVVQKYSATTQNEHYTSPPSEYWTSFIKIIQQTTIAYSIKLTCPTGGFCQACGTCLLRSHIKTSTRMLIYHVVVIILILLLHLLSWHTQQKSMFFCSYSLFDEWLFKNIQYKTF